MEIPFTGTRIALLGRAHPAGGYARIELAGAAPLATYVDFYAKVPEEGLRFVSPELPHGDHVLRVSVTGEIPQWSDKQRSRYGSTGSDVTLTAAVVLSS